MNILEEANKIVNLRSEEKERQYGPFSEGMERAAMILSGMTGQKIEPEFMYKAMIALKFSRESYNHKEDSLLDAVAYIGALNNYYEGISKIDNDDDNEYENSEGDKYASVLGLRNLFTQNPKYICCLDKEVYGNKEILTLIEKLIREKNKDVFEVGIVGNIVKLKLTK